MARRAVKCNREHFQHLEGKIIGKQMEIASWKAEIKWLKIFMSKGDITLRKQWKIGWAKDEKMKKRAEWDLKMGVLNDLKMESRLDSVRASNFTLNQKHERLRRRIASYEKKFHKWNINVGEIAKSIIMRKDMLEFQKLKSRLQQEKEVIQRSLSA